MFSSFMKIKLSLVLYMWPLNLWKWYAAKQRHSWIIARDCIKLNKTNIYVKLLYDMTNIISPSGLLYIDMLFHNLNLIHLSPAFLQIPLIILIRILMEDGQLLNYAGKSIFENDKIDQKWTTYYHNHHTKISQDNSKHK
jgi:hypothetical protein